MLSEVFILKLVSLFIWTMFINLLVYNFQGSRVQVEDVRLQDVKDEFEDMNSDQDPDDPDSLSDTDRNSLSELSDETERKVKK